MQQLKHCLNFKKMLHLPQLLENTTFIKISHPVAPWEPINIKTQPPLAKKKKLQHAEGSYAENAMATHSSSLVWKIPWTEEPSRLQSMRSLGVGHDQATSLSLFTFMHWRRNWQSTPVFLPGESHGQGSLVGCRLWGCTESDTTEVTQQKAHMIVNLLKL